MLNRQFYLLLQVKIITQTCRLLNVLVYMKENSTKCFCMSSTVTVRMGCSSHGLQLVRYIYVKPSKHCKDMLYPIGGCKKVMRKYYSEGKKLFAATSNRTSSHKANQMEQHNSGAHMGLSSFNIFLQ